MTIRQALRAFVREANDPRLTEWLRRAEDGCEDSLAALLAAYRARPK